MNSFQLITATTLAANEDLRRYLELAQNIGQAERGGTFVGNRGVAPESLRVFGIVLPKGGMILPQHSPEEIRSAMAGAATAQEEARKKVGLVRYNGMENAVGRIFIGAFLPDGQWMEAEEISGTYHKNGKWSYSDFSVVVPEEALLLCVSRSTHNSGNARRYLKRRDHEAVIGKLDELSELPKAASVSQLLGVEITPEALERIALYRASELGQARWAELKVLGEVPTY